MIQRLLALLRISIAACLAAGWLAGCAPLVQNPAPAAQVPAPADLVAAAPRGVTAEALEAAAAVYEGQTGLQVRVETLAPDRYTREVNAVLLAGLERYDLVLLPAGSLGKWLSYKALRPLASLLAEDPVAAAGAATLDLEGLGPWLEAVSPGGELAALPTQPDPLVLWYRADLLEAAGMEVPRSWEAFLSAAQALQAPPERYGAAFPADSLSAGALYAALLGGQVVDESLRVALETEPPRRALEFLIELRGELAPPGVEDYSAGDVLDALKEGRVVFGFAPLSAGSVLLDCAQAANTCTTGSPDLAWDWLPGAEGADGAPVTGDLSVWAVPLRAPHPQAAARFAAWLGSAAGVGAWAEGGGSPAHTGAAAMAQVPHYHLYLPPVKTVEQLWKPLHQAVHSAIKGEQPPEEALEEAAGEMKKALRQVELTP